MGRYDAWNELFGVEDETLHVTFDHLEELIGRALPPSAAKYPEWWGNAVRNPQAVWVRAGWVVDVVDRDGRTVTFRRGSVATRGRTGRGRVLDGDVALEDFVRRAGYASVAHAVAAHCVFLHPDTVGQAQGRAIVPVVRDAVRRGQLGELPDGRRVVFCDNLTPTDVFLWAADRVKGKDVQFNHIWTRSLDPDAYTALWNLCCTPSFLAKTTDTHVEVQALLRYRAWDLYGQVPNGEVEPARPDGYESYEWAPSPDPLPDLEGALRARMKSAPGRRAVLAAREIGWAFSLGPDLTV